MKRFYFIGIFTVMIGCNDSASHIKNKHTEVTEVTKTVRIHEVPNANTTTEQIITTNQPDNQKLFKNLLSDFKKQAFIVKSKNTSSEQGVSFNDCTRNVILTIQGDGIRSYYIKRNKSKPKNYYPDFSLSVFEFDTAKNAQKTYKKIQSALGSGGRFCNLKDPKHLVINKNEVFYFTTRAEMFRGYIKDFGEKIAQY